MVAINSGLEIDITGQVVSDTIGLNVYSGVGGQMGLHAWCAISPGGKPVICLTSTTNHGESRLYRR